MTLTIHAEERRVETKNDLRQLRSRGKVPGVVFGKNIGKSTPIAIEEKELLKMIRSNANAVVQLTVPSIGTQPVMLTDVQRDPLSRHLLHCDFHQIDMNRAVRTQARLELHGIAPGDREGGIVQAMLHEIEIQCLPGSIPEVIAVDISTLQIGENILAGDLKMPQGVTMRTDPELVVVTILAPQKDLTEEEAEDAAVESIEATSRAGEAQHEEVKTEA